MKNAKIHIRLIAAFTLVITLMGILGVIASISLSMVSGSADKMYEENIEPLGIIAQVNDNFLLSRFFYTRAALYACLGEKSNLDESLKSFDEYAENLLQSVSDYKNVHMEEEEYTYFDVIETTVPVYISNAESLKEECYDVFNGADSTQLQTHLLEMKIIAETINENLNSISSLNVQYGKDSRDSAESVSNTAIIIIISMFTIFVLVSVTLEVAITRGIERTIGQVIKKLVSSVIRIDEVAKQLSGASDNLAAGSSEQTAAIEETSATMNELVAMIKKTAENTQQASHLAQVSNEEAGNGMERMGKMVKMMDDIKSSSDAMSQTIKVIDNISFQTNLLAINATVEAARAGGEAGRSFSVVAQEVRNLSQNSAKAAENTTASIERNVTLTAQGRDASRSVAEALNKITADSGELSRIIKEISAASEQEASGMAQINEAIGQMEKVTQRNAAVAEENAASSSIIKDESSSLKEAMDMVKGLIREMFYE